MNIIRAVLVCEYLLILEPYLVGYLLCKKTNGLLENSTIYRFIIGFLCMVGMWGILAYPFSFLLVQKPFHELCIFYMAVLVSISVVGVLIIIKEYRNRLPQIKSYNLRKKDMICLVFFVAILGMQLYRIVCTRQFEYSDEMAYVPFINDMLYTDRIFSKDYITGVALQYPNLKRLFAPWYGFIALLAMTSSLHPAFLCKVMMPMYVLLLFYCVTYVFGKKYSVYIGENVISFVCFSAIIVETFWIFNYRFYYTAYPVMWGKTLMMSILIPMIIVSLDDKAHYMTAVLLGACGATLSLMSAVIISIELAALFIYYFIMNKKKICTECVRCLACELPLFFQFGLYVCVHYSYIEVKL